MSRLLEYIAEIAENIGLVTRDIEFNPYTADFSSYYAGQRVRRTHLITLRVWNRLPPNKRRAILPQFSRAPKYYGARTDR